MPIYAVGIVDIMRLLDTYTGQFVEKDPKDEDTVYAILSHTWDRTGEQTFGELQKIQERYAQKRSEAHLDEGKPTPPYAPKRSSNVLHSSLNPSYTRAALCVSCNSGGPHLNQARRATPRSGYRTLDERRPLNRGRFPPRVGCSVFCLS